MTQSFKKWQGIRITAEIQALRPARKLMLFWSICRQKKKKKQASLFDVFRGVKRIKHNSCPQRALGMLKSLRENK